MFQNKHMMMLQGKKLYHHLKQISLCSKVNRILKVVKTYVEESQLIHVKEFQVTKVYRLVKNLQLEN